MTPPAEDYFGLEVVTCQSLIRVPLLLFNFNSDQCFLRNNTEAGAHYVPCEVSYHFLLMRLPVLLDDDRLVQSIQAGKWMHDCLQIIKFAECTLDFRHYQMSPFGPFFQLVS